MNPDVPEAHKLRGWYDDVGHTMDYSEFQSDGSSGAGGGKDSVVNEMLCFTKNYLHKFGFVNNSSYSNVVLYISLVCLRLIIFICACLIINISKLM